MLNLTKLTSYLESEASANMSEASVKQQMNNQTCREQRRKEVEPLVACVAVTQTERSLNRCCRDLGDASAWAHVSQYPVEPQMSVRVRASASVSAWAYLLAWSHRS